MRRFYRKYFTMAAMTALCLLLSLGAFAGWAQTLSDVEQSTTMKASSPMDKEPIVIGLQKGETVVRREPERIDLNGAWELTDQGSAEENSRPDAAWAGAYTVSVPSSISSALQEAGAIEDPMYGRNDAAAKALGERNWYYRKTFSYGGPGESVRLCFDGVADRCRIYLNGEEIGSHQGMFGGPYLDVTEYVVQGENTLVVMLLPVLPYTETVVFNCSYAWHYADLPPIGIWNDVYLEDVTEVEVDSPFITTVSHETGTLDLSVDLTAAQTAPISGTLNGTIRPKNFEGDAYSFTYEVNEAAAGNANVRLRFDLPEFRLWWPNGVGEQNLYVLEISFTDENGVTSYSEDTFAVRTLELTSGSKTENPAQYNRTVEINGRPVFMKGAGWCTIDAMMHFTREDYDRILSRAYDQGLNFLRAWGGGLVETDDFYDLCDEYGICVYQEWPTCWDSYKTQPADVLYETVILNTKRIRNHPSLIVYGGGNEGTAAADEEVLNNIGRLTYEYDGTRDFWRQDGGHGGAGMTHDHIWWGGQSPEHYASVYAEYTGNLHEYGLGSMMNLESIAKYATAEEMAQWPIDPEGTIAYHTSTFNGMKGWNPSPHGYDIDTHIWYASLFAEVNDLESLVTGSQIAQTMAKYFAIQNARINNPDVSLVCYYKFNDVYPGASWSVVDWYGTPKMAYYFIQDAFQPLMATAKFDRYNTFDKSEKDLTLPVHILDDADELNGADWKVSVKAYDNQFRVVKEESWSGSGSTGYSLHVGDFYLDASQTDSAPLYIVIDLEKNGEAVSRSYAFLNAEQEQGSLFYVPTASLEYTVEGNTYTVTNTGDVPAVGVHFICPEVSDTFRCSDNYFWLEPGETKQITVNSTEGVEGFDAFNLADSDDTEAPGAPGSLKAEAAAYDTLQLTWTAAKDNSRILQYEIYLNGEYYGYVKGSATEAEITGLSELTEYTVTLVAVDGNMNRSSASGEAACTTLADLEAPVAQRLKLLDASTAEIVFSRPVRADSAAVLDYYLLNNGARVTSAALLEDGVTVRITMEGVDETNLSSYTLTVMGVQDTTATGNYARRNKFTLGLDLVGSWHFEDGGETLADDSGIHSHGSLGGAEFTEGRFGNGLLMPESGETLLSESTDFRLEGSTIAFWIKPGALSGFNVLLAKGDKTEGHFEIYTSEGDLRIYGPEIGDLSFGVNLKYYEDQWTHLAFTCEDRKVSVYVNGSALRSVRLTGELKDTKQKLCLGSLPAGSMKTPGVFDEVYLFASLLSEEQIAGLYTNALFTDVAMEFAHYQVKAGSSRKINILYSGDASPESVRLIWTSSDESIATVDQDGTVTTYAYGTVLITAYTEDGKYIERCVLESGDFEEPSGSGPSLLLIVAVCCGVLIAAAAVFVIVMVMKINRKNTEARSDREKEEESGDNGKE